ncbi:MAG: hypothetical protein E5V25_01800 [Mesorhizobium sp.]|nr:MAG: hypothetical protein E5V25_01800 [Mesorhizobium sp.]
MARHLQQQFGQTPPIVNVNVPDPPRIGNDPVAGPICAGPLGPGPCAAVKAYLARLKGGFQATLPDVTAVQVERSDIPGVEAMCEGVAGKQPCSILQQEIVDSGRGPTVGPLPNLDALTDIEKAQECARQVGLDVVNFAACTGGNTVLQPNQQDMVDCAVNSTDTEEFAKCAAPLLGVKVTNRQQKLAECASRSDGDLGQLAECAGGAALGRNTATTLKCYREASGDAESFAECSARNILGENVTEEQKRAIECLSEAQDQNDVLMCSTNFVDLTDDQKALIECTVSSDGNSSDFIGCAGSAALDKYLGRDAKTAVRCASDSGDDAEQFALCAATGIIGENASKEQKIALTCAAQSGGDFEGMATCTGANLLNMELGLNPEQQIAVQCLVSSGGQPYAAAGCMATRLTARELTKCFTDGIGGDGCFGDNNDLTGRNGWTARTLGQIAGGPNSVINNPDQIWGGNNSFVRNPSQIWGGDNSFVRNPSQIWGGENSVFNKPRQLAPAPVQVGKIGNTRICLPWC